MEFKRDFQNKKSFEKQSTEVLPKKGSTEDTNIYFQVRKAPKEVRDKVHKMILDQSIDEKLLSTYAYALSLVSQLTTNSEDNIAFWKELEMNFLQRYTEETESDYAFKIPLQTLENYFMTVKNLNGTN